ncbi:DUF4468 domain-containing protein [Solitalea sp. MAHUQ-68]|uniref:DUF4468 domain-containing protein n=1 Tax=Solitalea agri TaxID=2953739 RepID=A0A9X2F404_9SPHI|nr:DUF4468 domain-containing protein [Solitalea agri]MCO4293809.1 DUF4468 domain-containing protein [Solitalea agri]
MKKFLFLFLFILPAPLFAQTLQFPMSDSTNKISYKASVKVDTAFNKVELFQRVKDWIQLNFQQENKVLHKDDLPSGTIIAKGFAGYTTKLNNAEFHNKLTWTMTITVRNGGYNYEMTDIYSSENASGNNAFTATWTTPIEDLILSEIAFKDNGDYKPLNKMHAVATDKSIKEVIAGLNKYLNPFEESIIAKRAAQLNAEFNKNNPAQTAANTNPAPTPSEQKPATTVAIASTNNQAKVETKAEVLVANNSSTIEPVKQQSVVAEIPANKPVEAPKTMEDLKKMQDNIKKLELELKRQKETEEAKLKLQKEIDELNAEIKQLEDKKAKLNADSTASTDSPKTMEDLKKMQDNIKKLEAAIKIQSEIDKLKEDVKKLETKKANLSSDLASAK